MPLPMGRTANAPGQSWKDRVRPGAFTAPSGTRITFDFEDVSREYDARGTKFDFPGVDDSYIQRTGFGSREYPLRCYFSGSNCDLLATAFEIALLESGLGKLEHPLYGTPTVVPFGRVTRTDALKTAANQSIVEVTFFTTTGAIYPTAQARPQTEIQRSLDGFDLARAQQFAQECSLLKTVHKTAAAAGIRALLKSVSKSLDKVSFAVGSVNHEFRDLQDTVNLGMDVLIGKPLLLAQQISNLVKAPGRALTGLEERLDGYDDLAQSIFGSSAGNPGAALGISTGALTDRTIRIANDFHSSDLFAMNAVAGSVVACTNQPIKSSIAALASGANVFTTRPQVLAAAAAVSSQFANLVAWRDLGFAALGALPFVGAYQTDTGEGYQALQDAVARTVGYLVQASFSLLPERAIVLDRARTIVDVCAELYGSVDESLDFLINTNNLSGDEILELPAQKTIVYYPS